MRLATFPDGAVARRWIDGVARRLIYSEWPHGPGPLRASYETTALPVVNVQLEKAGVRLAVVLNEIFR